MPRAHNPMSCNGWHAVPGRRRALSAWAEGCQVLESLRKLPDQKDDPWHLSRELLSSKRKRKRSQLPELWWRKPIMVLVPGKVGLTCSTFLAL